MKVNHSYAVQPGRSKKAIGRVVVESVSLERLGHLTFDQVRAEGFDRPSEFVRTWVDLHGGYDPDEVVWRVQFRAIYPADYPLWEQAA